MSTTAWSAPQPLDKISLQICQLLAFPCYLQFISPFVNNFQAIDFNETETIKFYDIDFRELLHFLVQCGAILDTVRVQEPSSDLKHTVTIGSIELSFSYNLAQKNSSLTLKEEHSQFQFNARLVPKLISAICQLIFKCFGYSGNTNYLIRQYISLASIELLENPIYFEANAIFFQLDNVQIDYFLLYDIINRHKKVLLLLKKLSPFLNE